MDKNYRTYRSRQGAASRRRRGKSPAARGKRSVTRPVRGDLRRWDAPEAVVDTVAPGAGPARGVWRIVSMRGDSPCLAGKRPKARVVRSMAAMFDREAVEPLPVEPLRSGRRDQALAVSVAVSSGD